MRRAAPKAVNTITILASSSHQNIDGQAMPMRAHVPAMRAMCMPLNSSAITAGDHQRKRVSPAKTATAHISQWNGSVIDPATDPAREAT